MHWSLVAGFLVVGSIPTIIGIKLWHRARESERWPTVEAVILESQVKSGGKGSTKPVIRFSYRVNGQYLESDRVNVGWTLSAPSDGAARTVQRFPVNARVRAAVDPADSTYCVLLSGIQNAHRFVLAVALFITVVNSVVTVVVLQRIVI